ncbi:MAG: hypothetical protein AAGA77_09615 [Bacteroidota bacterium]
MQYGRYISFFILIFLTNIGFTNTDSGIEVLFGSYRETGNCEVIFHITEVSGGVAPYKVYWNNSTDYQLVEYEWGTSEYLFEIDHLAPSFDPYEFSDFVRVEDSNGEVVYEDFTLLKIFAECNNCIITDFEILNPNYEVYGIGENCDIELSFTLYNHQHLDSLYFSYNIDSLLGDRRIKLYEGEATSLNTRNVHLIIPENYAGFVEKEMYFEIILTDGVNRQGSYFTKIKFFKDFVEELSPFEVCFSYVMSNKETGSKFQPIWLTNQIGDDPIEGYYSGYFSTYLLEIKGSLNREQVFRNLPHLPIDKPAKFIEPSWEYVWKYT